MGYLGVVSFAAESSDDSIGENPLRRSLAACAALLLIAALAAGVPAAARASGPHIVTARGTAAPRFVTGLHSPPKAGSAASVARAHLASNAGRYHVADPDGHLGLLSIDGDGSSETVRFRQLYRGVEVFGAQYLVHMKLGSEGRSVSAVNGHYFTELTTSTKPRVSQVAALRLARASMRTTRIGRVDSHGLTVLPNGSGVLAYHFTVWGRRFNLPVRQEVFIGARAGGVVLTYNNLQADGPVTGSGVNSHGGNVPLEVFQRGSTFEMRDQSRSMFVVPHEGEIRTHDAEGTDGDLFVPADSNLATSPSSTFSGTNTTSGAVDAHWGAGEVFEFYKGLGRNSIDDEGMSIVSVVNAGDIGGAPLFNAFWNGSYMTYGNPDPTQLHPFSADLDVVGHELTHGVTQFSANLVYLNQSGAMNEAYSDYFGNAIDVTVSGTPMSDPEAGFIGEDLCKVPQPDNWACPLRDLNDGTTTDDFIGFLVDFDNGGVHLNSTIYGGALWDLRESPELGQATADDLVYKQLTEFLTPLDDFTDGRNAMLAAADDMGLNQGQKNAVAAAFDAKGIIEGWDTGATNDADLVLENVAPLGFSFSPPQVSGNRFVIANYDDLTELCCAPEQIYVGNLDGTVLQEVGDSQDPNTFNDELPDLAGRRAVWSHLFVDVNGFNFDLQSRQLGGSIRKIARGNGFQWFPSIDNDLVAWENQTNQTDIRARFLGHKVKKVTGTPGEEFLPQASGNTVAWWNLGDFTRAPRIGIKNLKTGDKSTIKVKSDAAFLGPPGLSDKFVFWFQDKNGDGSGSIMRANLKGKRKRTLVAEGTAVSPVWVGMTPPPAPSANNRFVTYHDEFGYAVPQPNNDLVGRDVWLVPASGGAPKFMTCNAGDQAYPSIGNGSTVAWLDAVLGRTDLMTSNETGAGCQP